MIDAGENAGVRSYSVERKANMGAIICPPPECVIRDGRGFIVENQAHRIIVTAAHCLPKLPPSHAASYTAERTYKKLLGPLDGNNNVWAECLFVDPVADIAVLGGLDDQELSKEADAYGDLIGSAPALRISGNITKDGWVLSLERRWVPMPLDAVTTLYGMSLCIRRTLAGQSGSPILNAVGRAVGVIVVGGSADGEQGSQGPQPILWRDLPGKYLLNWA